MVNWVSRVIRHFYESQLHKGVAIKADARTPAMPHDSVQAVITDPPYYDAIWYGDLSDLFAVWLRRTSDMLGFAFSHDVVSDKQAEIIKSTFSEKNGLTPKDDKYYEEGMANAFRSMRSVLQPSGICVVVFAHKSTAGWEAILTALINAGWVVTNSWPIDTEREARMTSIGQAALASSIHLVCRPREGSQGNLIVNAVGDWRDILQEVPIRIHEWMPRLASEGVVGADAIFACLGPALEIYSRYSRVEKASGEQVSLKEYLEEVWAVVAKEALNMIFAGADTSAFEEDARLTAMWLWTLSAGANGNGKAKEVDDEEGEDGSAKKSPGGYVLEFDAARKIAQGLGAHLEKLRSLVEVKGETARLLPVAERAQFLFGKDAAQSQEKHRKKEAQLNLYKVLELEEERGTGLDVKAVSHIGETVLDRLHQSMIFFAASRGEALKRFLVEDGIGKDQRFWKLAQAFSALYPSNSDEKRWVDGVLARKKGLGL